MHCKNYVCGLKDGCVCKCDSCKNIFDIKQEIEEMKAELEALKNKYCSECGKLKDRYELAPVPTPMPYPYPIQPVQPYQPVQPVQPYWIWTSPYSITGTGTSEITSSDYIMDNVTYYVN